MSPRRRGGAWESFPEYRPRRPGPGPKRAAGRQPFGRTWWARAWVEALEGRARLDPNRLPRGRTYARTGAVGDLALRVGEISAPVQGSRARPYRVTVRVRTFDDQEWSRILDAFSAEIGHTAALLDGELPPEAAEDAAGVGLDLLPGPGEIQPRCSCPDWADPCKHSAAVCYLVADELDRDPFGLLLLRGRDREEVLAALRARRSGPSAASADEDGPVPGATDPGVPARAVWHRQRTDTPEPPLPPMPPEHPGRPPILPTDVPPGTGIDAGALRALALDAAARAHELARGAAGSGLELTVGEDLARRAATWVGPRQVTAGPDLAALAKRAGLAPRELLRRALAWQVGGPAGVAAYEDEWDPEPADLVEARQLLGPGARSRHNRVTARDQQLRLGREGRWYPFRRASDGGWDPDGEPWESTRSPGGTADLDDDLVGE